MTMINDLLPEHIRTVGIAGHVNPDGDAVGSCAALCLYLKKNRPDITRVDLYLEAPKPELMFLKGVPEALTEIGAFTEYDLFITCDVSDYERIAVAAPLFDKAVKRLAIDHHVSNAGFADINYILPDASSCAEVLTGLFDMDLIDRDIAEALYTGMIHDTGVFQYSNTSPVTMRCAAALMEKGIDFSRIIDDSFNTRTFIQNRLLGYCLQKAASLYDGRCIVSSLTLAERDALSATSKDHDIVVSQLRLTEGAEAAIFAYETEPGIFKVSLRSNLYLDVSAVAQRFGGGGHVRASGCTVPGNADEVLKKVSEAVGECLKD